MEEKDKILLNAYLDGEASENDVHKVEQLLKNDVEANEYLNDLKFINNQLSAQTESEINTTSYKESREFVEKEVIAKLDTSETGFFSFFQNVALRNVLTYSIIAGVFFNVGFFSSPTDENETTNLLINFDKITTLEKVFPKYRSQDTQELDELIQLTLDEMIESKIINSRIVWSGDTFFASIKDAYSPMDKTTCYKAELFGNGQIKEFTYCINETNKSIFYND